MRQRLRRLAMTGILAVAGTSGVGVSAASACDHGPAPGFVPGPSWGYGGMATSAVRFGGLPEYDLCPVCHPIGFVPPPCPPPPCGDEFYEAVGYRRISYRGYRRADFSAAYPAPAAPYASPQGAATYEAPYYPAAPLALPTKQAPGVYGTPQYPDPAAGPSAPVAAPQAQAPYSSQSPPAGYGQAPPLPSPDITPQP